MACNQRYKERMKNKNVIVMIVLSGLILSLHACSFLPSSPLSTPPDEPITETQEPITKEADLPENTPPEAPEPEPLAEIEESSIHGIGSQHKYEFGVLMTTDKTKPGVPAEWQQLFAQYGGMYVAPTLEKTVYLTFDLGYEAGYTNSLLDTLKQLHIRGTFFLLGQYMEKNPAIVKRIVQEGHAVGSHSYYHDSLPSLTDQAIIEDTQKCNQLYHQLTGKNFRLYRFPKGEFSEYSLSVIQALGYPSYFWSIAYMDWEKVPGGPDECYQKVMDHIHPGAIVLMHVVTDDNLLALPRIVQSLTEQGYTFAGLDEI